MHEILSKIIRVIEMSKAPKCPAWTIGLHEKKHNNGYQIE